MIENRILWYTRSSYDTFFAVKTFLSWDLPCDRPIREGSNYGSGLLCAVPMPSHILWPYARSVNWELVDDDGHFKIWRARDSSNLFLKESHFLLDDIDYEVTSIYSQ